MNAFSFQGPAFKFCVPSDGIIALSCNFNAHVPDHHISMQYLCSNLRTEIFIATRAWLLYLLHSEVEKLWVDAVINDKKIESAISQGLCQVPGWRGGLPGTTVGIDPWGWSLRAWVSEQAKGISSSNCEYICLCPIHSP